MKRKKQYAGANNPLYHVTGQWPNNMHVNIMKPTRNPIGIYIREKAFEMQEFEYNENDIIYMFSDGITDQFGGGKGRKLTAKKFREIILNSKTNDMEAQKQFIDNELKIWKQDEDQVDDILVMGIKL